VLTYSEYAKTSGTKESQRHKQPAVDAFQRPSEVTRKIEEHDEYGLDYQEDDADDGQTTPDVLFEILLGQLCHESWIVAEHVFDTNAREWGYRSDKIWKKNELSLNGECPRTYTTLTCGVG
jgi:hypothetical protein